MKNLLIFCKSYEGDLLRVERLWESIQRFNIEKIDCYICIPEKDLHLFQDRIHDAEGYLHWVTDEKIIDLHPDKNSIEFYRSWDGRLSQQVIKAEFWRYLNKNNLGHASYLCLDSESVFVRNFKASDFMYSEDIPYTVMHQNKDLLQLAENKGIKKVSDHFHDDCLMMKQVFNRSGQDYDFGPTPVIWSCKVWRDLDEKYFTPLSKTIWEAIKEKPSELRWYGEALLHFQSIPIHPIEPIFRVYHYDWQYFSLKSQGETIDTISREYFGYLKQSSWEYEVDYGSQASRKSIASKCLRAIKRFFAQYR